MLTNEHDKSETHIVEELIQVKTDEIMLNVSISQPVTSEDISQRVESNQNKILKQTDIQTAVEIELCPGNLNKVECTYCKNYMHM